MRAHRPQNLRTCVLRWIFAPLQPPWSEIDASASQMMTSMMIENESKSKKHLPNFTAIATCAYIANTGAAMDIGPTSLQPRISGVGVPRSGRAFEMPGSDAIQDSAAPKTSLKVL